MPLTKLDLFLDGDKNGKTERDKQGRKVVETGKPFTLWSFQNKEKWFVDEDDLPTFYKLYCEDLRHCVPRYLTERSTSVGMLRVDLDFKYDGEVGEHKHTQDQVSKFVAEYMKEASRYIQMPDNVEAYVLEKDYPTYDPAKKISSSGIHLQIPAVKSRAGVSQAIRRALLSRMEDFFPSLGCLKGWDDIYDKSALNNTGNWPLLGSKKPEGLPYQIKYIIDWDKETGECSIDDEVPVIITLDLVRTMSVRSSEDEETGLTDFGKENTSVPRHSHTSDTSPQISGGRAVSAQRGRPAVRENGGQRSRSPSPGRVFVQPLSEHMLKYYEAHCKNLDVDKRCKPYAEWVSVGQCLKNIHTDLLDIWLDFSAQCPEQFNPREAIGKWDGFTFRTDGPKLSVGSLRHWSREDNYDQFLEIEKMNTDRLLEESASTGTENDVAHVVFSKYRDEFKCAKFGSNVWYQFVGHIWRETDRGVALQIRLSNDIARMYLNKEEVELHLLKNIGECNCKAFNPECDSCKAEQRKKSFNNMRLKLKTSRFKENVMKECRELFLDESMANKLDENKTLIAFANGVLDCATYEFRDGKPDDYLSFSTNIVYDPDTPYHAHKCWGEIDKFLRGVLPIPAVREYFLNHLSSCLSGANVSQKFHILTGTGSNGKSMLMNLMATAMGDYSCKAPISLLTQKRGKSGAAAPELVRMKGRRFVTMQEPDEEVPLNTGLMKELASCEKITARDLYAGSKQMIDFDIQCAFHLACNDKPRVNTTDGGTWRRLLVIEFLSKFVVNPSASNELPLDESIVTKTTSAEWATCFMSYLIHLFREGHGHRRIVPPSAVLKYTQEYKEDSDAIARFITECCVNITNPSEQVEPVHWGTISREFSSWKQREQMDKGSVQELKKKLIEKFGKVTKDGWSSFKLESA